MSSLSIITINYNNCKGLQRTINSVLGQTYQNFEYIIVDGGSTDGSVGIIEETENLLTYNRTRRIVHSSNFPGSQDNNHIIFKYVSESDGGIYNAMNKGAAMASGDYCQFLNSGDIYSSPDVLQNVMIEGIYADIAVGNTVIAEKLFPSPEKVSLELFIHGSLSHPAAFSKRTLLINNPFDESLHIIADIKFFLTTLVLKNASYQKLNTVIACFETGGISSTLPELGKQEADIMLKELIPARVLADYSKFLGDTDEYYKLYTTIYPSRFKWTMYNISLFFTKLFSLNRGWVRKLRFHA